MNKRFIFRLALILAVALTSSQSSMADTPTAGNTYTYDADGRLIQVTVSNGSSTMTIIYTYDQAGNLIEVSKQ
jgi:hypothetical protein